jgi:hypothetical protein
VALNNERHTKRLPNVNISLAFREPNNAVTVWVGEPETSTEPIVIREGFDQPNICFAYSILVGVITPEVFGAPSVIV